MTNTKETKPTLIFIISMEIHVEFPTLKLIGPINSIHGIFNFKVDFPNK